MRNATHPLKRSGPGFEWLGNQAALDFHNTASWRLDGSLPNERFEHYDDVVAWGVEGGLLSDAQAAALHGLAEAAPGRAQGVFVDARALRGLLHRVFHSVAADGVGGEGDVAELNARVGALELKLQPVGSTESAAYELAPGGVGDTLESVLWPVVWSAAQLLSSSERAQVRGCANDDCGWLFIDRSRRGNRRWCEMASCGNRAKVHSYHARRRAQ